MSASSVNPTEDVDARLSLHSCFVYNKLTAVFSGQKSLVIKMGIYYNNPSQIKSFKPSTSVIQGKCEFQTNEVLPCC